MKTKSRKMSKIKGFKSKSTCLLCLKAICGRIGDDGLKRKVKKINSDSGSSGCAFVKILISYILQNPLGIRQGELLLENSILSSLEKRKLTICDECQLRAEQLTRLHLELEKVQMQILDVLRNLQSCLKDSVAAAVGPVKNAGFNDNDDPDLSRFREVLMQKFISRELTDKALVRLERLNIAGYQNPFNLVPSHAEYYPNALDSRKLGKEETQLLESERIPVSPVKNDSYSYNDDCGDEDHFIPEITALTPDMKYEVEVSDVAVNHDLDKDECKKSDKLKKKRTNPGTKSRHSTKKKKKDEDDGEEDSCPDIDTGSGPEEKDDEEVSEAKIPPKRKRGPYRPRKKARQPKKMEDDDYCPDIDMVTGPEVGDENDDEESSEAMPPPKKKRGPYRKKVKVKPPKKYTLVWDCEICLENIPFKEMETHLRSHTEFEKIYTCDICPGSSNPLYPKRVFGTYKGLIWHYLRLNHYGQMPCIFCPDQSILFLRGQLCRHLYEVHHPNHKKLQCKNENCSEDFFDPYSCKIHFYREHSGTVFTCEFCGATLKTRKYLNAHVRRYHLQQERFFCASCPKEFKTKCDLQSHEKSMHGTELLQCPQCPKKLFERALKAHVRLVHGERKFHCQFCKKSFATSNHLKEHEEAHRGEKKYVCPQCPYTGNTRMSLHQHLRTHDGKKFPCPSCNKAFASKAYCDMHQRIHHSKSEKKETPYECEICHAVFAYKASRYLHRRKVHGVAKVNRSLAGVGVMKKEQEEVGKT